MCGIVALIANQPVASMVVEALKKLEYRGYDSAGLAVGENGVINRCRAAGKIKNLEEQLKKTEMKGRIGIGHTRWATHGAPIEDNAHPHISDGVAIVHNGIIENFAELKKQLVKKQFKFTSQTDTEVVAHLIALERKKEKNIRKAFLNAVKKLKGAFALAAMFEGKEEIVLVARCGPPLAVGFGEKKMMIGSDAVALAPFCHSITYLEDGDCAEINQSECAVFNQNGKKIEREKIKIENAAMVSEKGNYRHFMIKEIYEQPEVIGHTLAHYLEFGENKIAKNQNVNFKKFNRISIVACGTAFYAGLVAKYWFERYAKIPVDVDVASEFRYREPPVDDKTLALFISQSGETADTIAGMKYAKKQKLKIGAIVNVHQSTLAREADFVFPTKAGTEIGVASTKAFTCQLATLAALAVVAGVQKGHINEKQEKEMVKALGEAPRYANEILKHENEIAEIAHSLAHKEHVLYLGRDTNFPIAMEGALKIKEISYIHAEGYGAGELKHGPIALVDEEMPIVAIAPHDRIFAKVISNMQEVNARGGKFIIVTDKKGNKEIDIEDAQRIVVENMPEIITPIMMAIPVQLLAYHTAAFMGTDVDQPRNLAKSVTVE